MSRRAAWRAAGGGVGLGLSAGWNLSNVGAIADETAAAYGVSLAMVGVFTTALFVMHMAMQLPAGRLTDRSGARRVPIRRRGVLERAFELPDRAEARLRLRERRELGDGARIGEPRAPEIPRLPQGVPRVDRECREICRLGFSCAHLELLQPSAVFRRPRESRSGLTTRTISDGRAPKTSRSTTSP